MKKIAVLTLLLIVILGAGCASKEENNAVNTTSEQQGVNPEEAGINTTEAVQSATASPMETGDSANAQVSEPIPTETSSQQNNTSTEVNQSEEIPIETADDSRDTQLVEVTPKYISPEIAAMKILSNDPDISVENVVFVDNRDYAESTNWDINEQLKNEGSQPVYLGVYYGEDDLSGPNDYYYLLQPGESVWTNNTTFFDNLFEYNLTNLPAYHITSHKTIVPEVSPEFSNFKLENVVHHRYDYEPKGFSYVDIHSVKYVVKDAAKGWASLVVAVSSGNEDAKVSLRFKGTNGNSLSYADEYWIQELHVPAGQTVEAELPIREGTTPDMFGGVEINSFEG